MWFYPEEYDVIVIGAGHSGCEAAHASAKMGSSTLLLTMNLDTIGKMSCNPAIGGTAKGHIVREIDALGGIMGKIADRTGIQFRMLNASKGPAVWSPRCQSDKLLYALEMKKTLENIENLHIKQGTTEDLVIENGVLIGVTTQEGISFRGKTVIISSGTFMRGLLHIGDTNFSGGRAGDKASIGLSKSLETLGFRLGRLKTGTPPRVNKRSIDFSQMEIQPGDDHVRFSHDALEPRLEQIPCYITYTTDLTKKVVTENLKRSAMYSGKIHSIGPRYCPSIEDKFVRFADKERHQIFLEPEGLYTNEIYVNGISTSLPFDVQLAMIHTITGLEKAEIMRPAYAIEYDYVLSGQLYDNLETKLLPGLFLAGQVNGTTGYEEAAGQGLIAGINAALKARGRGKFSLLRSESYIGVMIDDLISKDLDEPYRMFTSRAEHRLLLRQDNADLRLREYGYNLGIVDEKRYQKLLYKKQALEEQTVFLKKKIVVEEGRQITLAQKLCHAGYSYEKLLLEYPSFVRDFGQDINRQIELTIQFEGYILRQEKEAKKLSSLDLNKIPENFDFDLVVGLRNEAKVKLKKFTPSNLGQASRISGVSPADITILMVTLRKRTFSETTSNT